MKRGSSDKKLNSSGDKKLNSSCDKKLNSDHHENSKKRRKKVSNKSSTSHDEKLKQLEAQLLNLDPNSEEAKSQRRLIRNRMSAQVNGSTLSGYNCYISIFNIIRNDQAYVYIFRCRNAFSNVLLGIWCIGYFFPCSEGNWLWSVELGLFLRALDKWNFISSWRSFS